MSKFLIEFKFKKAPIKITYFNEDPLELNSEFIFFHNKSKFRKELTRLQYLIKSYTKIALHAAGIRDSYLKQEYSDKFLIVIFTTPGIVKKTNEIVQKQLNLELNPKSFYLKASSEYILLLSKDLNGLVSGVSTLESVLTQTFEDYLDQKNFDEYIKIRPFELIST